MSVGLELQELQKGAKQAETILQKINNLSNIQGRFSFAGLDDNIKKLNTLNTELEKYNGKISVNRKAFHLKGADTSIDDLKKLQSALETFNGGTIKLNGKKIDPSPLLETLRNVTKEIEKENAKIDRLAGLKAKYKGGYKSKNAQADTKETIKGLEEQEKRFAELNKLHGTHSRQLDETRRKLDRLKASYRELNKIRGDEKRVGSAKVSATSDARFMGYMNTLNKTPEPNPELSRMNAYYKELEAKSQKQLKSIRVQNSSLNQQGNILQRLRTYAANYFSIFSIWNFVKNIVNTTKEFERQQVALEGIIGSAAKATQVFGQLKQMALKSPFNIAELTSFTKQLAAYNIAVDELLPTTNKLADLSAGLGVEMSRLILAYGQVNAASVLRGQELRQFTEAGVPLVQKLADKFTALNGTLVTTGEVFDMISKRQVSFDMVSQVLTDMTSEGGEFYKMQENLNNTIYGQIEKLKELWSLALKEIGDGSNNIIMNVIQRLQSVVKKLPALLDGIKVGGFAYIVKQLLQLNFGAISFAKNLKKCSGIAMKLKFTMKAMTMMNWWSIAIAGIGLIAAGISNAIRKSKEWEKEVSRINSSFDKDTAKLTVGFDNLIAKLSSAGEGTKAYADALETLKTNYKDFVNDNIIQALIEEAKMAKEAGNEYRALAESIKASIVARKEYERHETLKNTAADELAGELKIFDLIGNAMSELDVQYSTSGVAYSTNQDDNKFLSFYQNHTKQLQEENLQTAFNNAMTTFFANGGKTVEELSEQLTKQLDTYSIPDEVTNFIMDNIDKIFNSITRNEKWKTYLTEVGILEKDQNKRIKDAFADVPEQITGDRYKELTGGGRSSKEYNAWGTDKEEQKLYIETFDSLLKKLIGDKKYAELSETEAYENAMEMDSNDYGKGKALVNAAKEYADGLDEADQEIFNTIQNITNAFIEAAGTFGEQAKIVRSNAAKMTGFKPLNLTSKEKDWVKSRTDVNDANYKQMQNAVWEEWEKNQQDLKQARSKGASKADKAMIPELERTETLLSVLLTSAYYGKKVEDKKGGGQQREAISAEFSDFINSFKNAYSTYKNAIQKGGTEMGLGYVRNDKQFQEMFGQFFNGIGGEQFQKLMNVKIGKKGDTTVGQTIQDKFLSGAEEGILDFESAALAVAKELEDYYNSEEKMKPYRKDYLNAAKELKRWVYSTVAKDNLTAALEEFEEGLKVITNTFENTNKSVETYRKLMEQGTAGDLGGQLGVSESDVLRPQSARQKDFISSYIAEFNNALGKFEGTTPFTLSANTLSSPTEVLKAIGKIDEVQRMNAGNFKSNELGSKSEQLKGMLKQLVDMMHQEMAGISGRAVSGTPMRNAIANTALGAKSSMFGFAESQSVAGEYGLIDADAIEKLLTSSKEQSTALFETFMKSEKGAMAADLLSGGIDKDAFFQKFDDAIYQLYTELGGTKMDDLHTKVKNGTATEEEKKQYNENIELIIPKTLKFELDLRKEDLSKSIDNFNAEGGKLGLGDEIRRYREAPEKYKKEYDDLTQRVTDTQTQRATAVSQMEQLQPAIKDGTATQEQIDQFNALQLEVANCDASLSQYNNRLTEIGENGSIAAAKEQMEALGDAQNKLNHFSKGFDSMQNAVIAVVDSLKACVDTFAKFYDIVNDGENPKWLTDIQEGMGNFIENFKTAVAPILAVVGAIIAVIVVVATLTTACVTLQIAAWPLLVIMAALIAVAAIVAGIMAAIQAHDNNLEHSIEDLKKQVEEFEDAAERLDSVAERMTGIEKLKTQVDALGQSLSSASAYAEMARLEEEKKDTDEEKVKEYDKQAFEASEEFENGMKEMLDELIGATEDWSSAMSDAIRSAFQNGDNAARSFRASIKEMMGDVVQSMLEMAILQPLIEDALQEWTNSDALKQKYTKNVTKTDENGNQVTVPEFDSEGYTEELLSNINDPEKAEDAYNSMQNAGDAYIDAVENLPDFLKDAFKFNSDTSSLSGGISGITEDTARQLEGLSNSQLMQLILINRTLTQYLEAATTSSDNNQYMANVQTHLQQINNNVGLILRSITELRDTPSRPLHVTMV